MTEIFIVGIFAALLFVMALCLIAYLTGHKKGVEDVVAFHNGVFEIVDFNGMRCSGWADCVYKIVPGFDIG